MYCPSSLEEAVHPISEHTDAADLGTALHKALEELIAGHVVDLKAIALAHHIDHGELADLYGYGAKAWLEIKEVFGEDGAVCEQDLSVDIGDGIVLTGHPDLVIAEAIIDWKSGRVRYDTRWQMEGYGRLTGKKYAYAAWLRERDTDEFELMSAEDFDKSIKKQVSQIGKVYCPGDHCGLCLRKLECDARNIQMKQTVALFKAKPTSGMITKEDLVKAYPFYRQVQAAMKVYWDCLKSVVDAEGSLDIGDGKELIKLNLSKESIDPRFGWDILSKHLTDEEMAKCVNVSKGTLEEVVKAKTERGKKEKAFAEVMGELRAAGAVSREPYHIMKAVKKKGN